MKAMSVILTSIWFVTLTNAKYGGGTGEPNDPYLIYTTEQMNNIGLHEEDWHKHFRLMADIDLSGYTGTDFNIIGHFRNTGNHNSFTGVFDGNSHSISNFSYTSSDASYVGIFGHISRQAMVKDLGLVDPNIDAGTGDNVGSLVGRLKGGTIAGCYVEGGTVVGDENVGGLIGAYDELENVRRYEPPPYTISHCHSSSTVRGTKWVGGLVGSNYYGLITDCYATGSVSGKEIVGGLVGQSGRGNIFTNISPTPGTVINCYSNGLVSGESDVGGLLGSYIEGPIIGCFWDIETSGQTSSAGGTGLTTAEMQTGRTFFEAGWDFIDESENGTDDLWWILEGQDYPMLWWQHGLAFYPYPKDGAIDVIQLVILKWLTGGSDIDRDVYFGEDKEAVASAKTESPGVYRGRQPGHVTSYDLGKLALDTTYYWRIDEIDDTIVSKGNVWSFTTAKFIVVDDFESYNDIAPPDPASRRVFDYWIEGFGTTTYWPVGAVWVERFAHSGAYSMAYLYDNSGKTSEATLTLVYPRDWSESGVTELSLWFYGNAANSAERMFVALNGTAVVYHDDPVATQLEGWNEWVINLQAFADQGVGLTNVNSITIGIGTKNAPAVDGGTGTMYFDDIRLYRPQSITSRYSEVNEP